MSRPTITQTAGKYPRASLESADVADSIVTMLNEHAEALDGSAGVSVMGYGAVGDGETDDTAAIQAAVDAAIASDIPLVFQSGTYLTSGYIDVANARGLLIYANGNATIRYASGDTAIVADAVATSDQMARSALLLRNCSDVVISGLNFRGDDTQNITSENIGCGVYATRCVGTVVHGCSFINGGPFVQDAMTDQSGTGDSLAVASGVVTLTDAAGLFLPGHVHRRVTISGATNELNNGTFLVESAPGATTLTYLNSAAVAETSGFRWTLDNSDRDTRVESCRFDGCRQSLRTGSDAVIRNCHFEHPMNCDAAGLGTSFAVDGTTVTLTDASAPFKAGHVGKYITVAGSDTSANDGTFLITSATSTAITYENASGVAELTTADSTWWIAGGDKTGLGDGASALTESSGTVTLVSATAAFSASDVGKVLRISGATTEGNNGAFVIETVEAADEVTFSNASGVSEAYAGVWTVDAYDNAHPSDTYGSTHMIYLFAGRSNVLIDGCTFRGGRTTAVKVSGSSLPITNIMIRNCYAEECGSLAIVGADDTQDHTGITIDNNRLVNCATGRPGWTQAVAIEVLGARGVSITNNHFHYTRPSVSKVDGRDSLAGLYGIRAARYSAGISQPLEDVMIEGNRFTSDPDSVRPAQTIAVPIACDRVGQLAYYRTGGTLTKSGDIMTLTDSSATFGQSLVGCAISLVNSASSNDGDFTVLSVGSATTLTYENAAGTGAGAAAGTYRISPKNNRKPGGCVIARNQVHSVGTSGIETTQCVAPEIIDNTFSGGAQIQCNGDVAPRVVGNREVDAGDANARIRLNAGTSWPYLDQNLITNGNLNLSVASRDWGVGVDSGTPVDYPLLGKRGRCKPTQGKQEMVIAYGAGLVDGDTIQVSGTTLTYKASAPGAGQFNSFASLVTAIDAIADHDCADYGAQFSPTVTTEHLRVQHTSATTTEVGQIYAQVNTLNPTALVMPRNEVASSEAWLYGRGAASTSTSTPDRSVVWSLQTTRSGLIGLVGENEAARTLLGPGSQATGTITCTTKANYADTDYMTIGDGLVAPKLYEFDTAGDGVTAGRVQVDISGATTAAQVAAILKTAIEANQPSIAVTDAGSGVLTLAHKLAGAVGNVTLTENVTHAGHTVAGMSGGALGGYHSVKNGTEDPGACEVVQHATTAGTEEFRWVLL